MCEEIIFNNCNNISYAPLNSDFIFYSICIARRIRTYTLGVRNGDRNDPILNTSIFSFYCMQSSLHHYIRICKCVLLEDEFNISYSVSGPFKVSNKNDAVWKINFKHLEVRTSC